ncbi:E3 ubiquitin-protein ligase UPL1-like isoform X2 [Henckelia pumila]|uniref:E3 ubiquitin-protein ligase UPL1-like isoform X2 n=1 Tax=Henckelia pumila TaxID=405737 RepID=UPI003C6E3E4B
MKLKQRRALEVPPKIQSFIDNVTAAPLENIEESLKSFFWVFDKGDFRHWDDLFNHFDTYFEKCIKPRKDLQLDYNFLESDPPFPREAVLHVLRVIWIILENCSNKIFYSSYEHHLSSLLFNTDSDVVEASLQTLVAFLGKSNAKYRDASLRSRLFAFAQGWGAKEEGLGLISCALPNGLDPIASKLGCCLHFQFYVASETSNESTSSEQPVRGLQVISMPDVNTMKESNLELLHKLVVQYKVPHNLRFSLFTRLRFARAFSSAAARHQYTCIRLYAFIGLVQASSDTVDLVSYFNTEPEFINELVTLLSYGNAIPGKIRTLSLISLVSLCQDRSHQSTVLSIVTSGGHRGFLSSLMLKTVDSVVNDPSNWSIISAESLLLLIKMLVSSSSGCSAMHEVEFISTLLPLLKDVNPQHLKLVRMVVYVLEAFMIYSNSAAALFRDLRGLDEMITRLMVEVSHIDNGSKQQNISIDLDSSDCSGSQITSTFAELDSLQPLYSDALVLYRRLLIKALLDVITLGIDEPGTRLHGSEENLLLQCICIIFKKANDFGGGIFSLAATVMSYLLYENPTRFSILEAVGLPSAFIDAIMNGVPCSAKAITCIPQCLDALCLNKNGFQAVKERNALRCFVKVFTSKTYLRVLAADTLDSLSSGLDELMSHASSLHDKGVDMLIEILNNIAKIGSGLEEVSQSTHSLGSSEPVPLEIKSENRDLPFLDVRDSNKPDIKEPSLGLILDTSSTDMDLFLPDCISNASRFLESILQNSDTCRIFVEKKGIECVLQLLTLRLVPLSASVGQRITYAFKKFSPQHSTSLARALCLFLRGHLKLIDKILTSIGGLQLAQVEFSERVKILRGLSSLEGILSLCNSLLKGTTTIVSELCSADADVFKELGKVYREILWQISLCCDLKVAKNQSAEVEPIRVAMRPSNVLGRESDDEANIPSIRYMNPVASAPHSQLGVERELLSVVHPNEGLSRHSLHSLARMQGIRTGRYLEAFKMDSEAGPSNAEISYNEMKQKSHEILVFEILNKLASTMQSFFTALLKGSSPNRRRTETASLISAAKIVRTALAKFFLEALGFSGYSNSFGQDISLSVKCRYLGKVVVDMVALTFDSQNHILYSSMINNFYVHGTFKELLTTFEATSQLLWTLPCAISTSGLDLDKLGEGGKPSESSWLFDTLQSFCCELEYFVNSGLLLSSTSASQLLVQPIAVGLSLGSFPVPKDPETFILMLQSQVLEVVHPILSDPLFPKCGPSFITTIISLIIHVCNGVSDVKRNRGGFSGSVSQHFMSPSPDEVTIATIVEMGFSRARAEEAVRRLETNSVEMALEWLFNHAEDPVQEDNELARALALSLGSSSEMPKINGADKATVVLTGEGRTKIPSADDILATTMKLFQSNDAVVFPLTDLLVTVCNRNSGEDRLQVICYLVKQLKLCPLDFSKDSNPLGMISLSLALIISENGSTQGIAVQNGIVSIAIDILMNFMGKMQVSNGPLIIPKCISALLLILDSLLQMRPRLSGDAKDGKQSGPLSDSTENQSSHQKNKSIPAVINKNDSVFDGSEFEGVLGKPTGYLTMEECSITTIIACDLIKRHVSPMALQAVLQLCARLTKSHVQAVKFLESGGLIALFGIPRNCFFPGYFTLASAIIRHLLEDPQTLQLAMELEIRQTVSRNRQVDGISVRTFLTSMTPIMFRNPKVFMRAAVAVCQLVSLGGRFIIILSKEKEKEKSKVSVVEAGASSNECRIAENMAQDGSIKYGKGHKKVSTNLTQVIDFLLEIVLRYSMHEEDDSARDLNTMEVDEPTAKRNLKLKDDETVKLGSDGLSDLLAVLAMTSFALKLLSDILSMCIHATEVILKRDLEMSQLGVSDHIDYQGHRGVIHHILHCLLPLSIDKSVGLDKWRDKLSEKASWFLVVLVGRSSEGRGRVINELFKALSFFTQAESNPSCGSLLPDKKIFAFVDLVYLILSVISSSGNLPGSGSSLDIARSMIDGGIVHCLSDILQAIDLDHPNAPKLVSLVLKSLEILTRAANESKQVVKSDVLNKKKWIGTSGRPDAQFDGIRTSQGLQTAENGSNQHGAINDTDLEAYSHDIPLNNGNQRVNLNISMEQEMRIEENWNCLQHPLLLRPSHSGDLVLPWAFGRNTSVIPSENSPSSIFDGRLSGSAPSPQGYFFTDLDSLCMSSRRGRSDTRWTDDGIPQASGQAAAIAQAVEERFISLLSNTIPVENAEKFSHDPSVPEGQWGDPIIYDNQHIDIVVSLHNGDQRHNNDSQDNQPVESRLSEQGNTEVLAEQVGECQQETENIPSLIVSDNMEMGENDFGNESLETLSSLITQNDVHFDMTSRDHVNFHAIPSQGLLDPANYHASSVTENNDVEMTATGVENGQRTQQLPWPEIALEVPSLPDSGLIVQNSGQIDDSSLSNEASNSNAIDPTFLDALPADLRAEVLASQQAQPAPVPSPYAPSIVEDIDPEFLAALPPDIQAEVLTQQRVQRIAQQSDGQPVDMDNASIIATFSADLREEVLLTSPEAVLSALPSPLLAEAQMLRDRALDRHHARSLFGNSQRINNRGNRLGFGFDRQTLVSRSVGDIIGKRSSLSESENIELKDLDGETLLDTTGLKALIRLLQLAQPLEKGLLQRLLLNLCTYSEARAVLIHLLLDMINPETVGIAGGGTENNALRLYGCQPDNNGRSQLRDGVPSIVMRRVLEVLTHMATNHSGVASLLFHFETSYISECAEKSNSGGKCDRGKDKITREEHHLSPSESLQNRDAPLILLLRLINHPLCLRTISHLEQVMGLLQVVVFAAVAKVELKSNLGGTAAHTGNLSGNETARDIQKDRHLNEVKRDLLDKSSGALNYKADGQKSVTTHDILRIPRQYLHDLCSLLEHEGFSDKVYTMAGEVLRKLAVVAFAHRKFFVSELLESAQRLSRSAVNELISLRDTRMLGLITGSMTGDAVLRVLQTLIAVTSVGSDLNEDMVDDEVQEEHTAMWKLNVALESLWKELSECISAVESELSQNSHSSVSSINITEQMQVSSAFPLLPRGSQRLLPFIEGFFVLCEKLQSKNPIFHQDNFNVTAREVKESAASSASSSTKCVDTKLEAQFHHLQYKSVTFARFAEKHRRLLNAFIRQNSSLLEKSLCMMLKTPRLIDFDNKRAYFRSRIRQQHGQHPSGPLRISVRRAYILEDSYNHLRMRPTEELKGRLKVQFQGEEGIDAGGLTREWYQILSTVVFDKGALLFTTVGNNATFQPNPNSVYQTEHLSYFRFVGRVVAKALFDGQLLDVYFTRSFYKHILGVKVTYHDIEAVDPDYYKNLKWMLENDVSDIPDLTFSIDADEEKHILYEKTEVADYELKPGGRNMRVTEETKHEYVDLVADHILTNAIRPQINSFLEGFNELVPRELVSLFNDKELELLISGLPEIDLDDLKANTEYTGYTMASNVVQWFWKVVQGFNKEDMASLLQFVTGTSKVPLEGFKALQGISGPQRFQIHKAYGAPERLPSAHTCFNQLDLPEYSSKEQLQERMLLAIHEASEGFGFC